MAVVATAATVDSVAVAQPVVAAGSMVVAQPVVAVADTANELEFPHPLLLRDSLH
jgi:hypothetical protein